MKITPFKPHLTALISYTLLTIILTWPMSGQVSSHIPGEETWAFDESTFIWNMGWFKHSILTLHQTPLESSYTFYPLGVSLTTYTFNLFNAAFGLPFQLAFSLPIANNMALLFSYISSGYGTFLLGLYLLRSNHPQPPLNPPQKRGGLKVTIPSDLTLYLAAFLAGAVFAFSASRMMYVALGHYNFVTIQWFPFYVLFLYKAMRQGGLMPLIATTLCAAMCLYAELTYSVFLIFLTMLIVLGEIYTKADRFWKPISAIARLLAIVALTFVLTAPFILSVLPDFLDPAYAEPGWGEGLKLSADLVGLVTLTPLHPWSGLDWVTELRQVIEGKSRFSDANTLFLGYGVLLLALIGVMVRWTAGRVWLWATVLFTTLSLGPLLTINGQNRFSLDGLEVTYPLPFALLHYIPLINANRVPNRFGIPLTLALAVLVGYGSYGLLRQLDYPRLPSLLRAAPIKIVLAAGLLIGLLFDQFSLPIPMTDAGIPELYHEIGQEDGDFTIMQLPLGWRNSYGTLGAERTQLQYYQTAHQRPMLGGNTSRNPAFKFDYYRRIPLFYAITEAELYRQVDEDTLNRARQQAAELMRLYNIKYLVIHDPIPHRKPYEDTFMPTQALTLDLIPHEPAPIYQSPGVRAFAVKPAPIPDPLKLDFGEWTSDPYRGHGWAGNETVFDATANWVTATEAELFFPVEGNGPRQLTLQIAPFRYANFSQQTVGLRLNGQFMERFTLSDGWQSLEVSLPEAFLKPGLNRLKLQFAYTAQPRAVLPTNLAIGQTGINTPIDIEVNSGVEFAFVTVGFGDEVIDGSSHRRGLNLIVIDEQSGEVLLKQGFDTAANEFEAAALAQFIDQIKTGHIVVVASQGAEATAHLTETAMNALTSIGLNTESLSPPFSAIGVKGSPMGTALQATGEGNAYLRIGAVPDNRPLAAAVDWVMIRP